MVFVKIICFLDIQNPSITALGVAVVLSGKLVHKYIKIQGPSPPTFYTQDTESIISDGGM